MKKLIVAAAIAMAVNGLASGAANADTRTNAMGGAGVANGKYLQAGFLNPALMNNFGDRDDFGLILPSISVEVDQRDSFFDGIDDFQDAFDELERLLEQQEQFLGFGGPSEQELDQARDNLADAFSGLGGNVAAEFGVYAALGIPNRFASTSLFINVAPAIFSSAVIADQDIDTIRNAESTEQLDNLLSEAFVVGRSTTEFGLAIGRKFTLFDREIGFGVSPKLQRVDTFTYLANLQNFDNDEFNEDEFTSEDSGFNVDVGATMPLVNNFSVGLVARNILGRSIDAAPVVSNLAPVPVVLEYKIEPELTAGIGYSSAAINASLDIDLTANNYLGLSSASQLAVFGESRKTQFARIGMELDVFGWAQARVGYRHDMEGTYEGTYTAGLGFAPFGLLNLSLSAMYASEDNFGAGVQFSLTF